MFGHLFITMSASLQSFVFNRIIFYAKSSHCFWKENCSVAGVLLSIIFSLNRVDQELNGKQDEPKSEQ